MCVKLPSRDLNHDLHPPLPTSTYTCGVTIALTIYGGIFLFLFSKCETLDSHEILVFLIFVN